MHINNIVHSKLSISAYSFISLASCNPGRVVWWPLLWTSLRQGVCAHPHQCSHMALDSGERILHTLVASFTLHLPLGYRIVTPTRAAGGSLCRQTPHENFQRFWKLPPLLFLHWLCNQMTIHPVPQNVRSHESAQPSFLAIEPSFHCLSGKDWRPVIANINLFLWLLSVKAEII